RHALVLGRVGVDAVRDRDRQLRHVERAARQRAGREPRDRRARAHRRGVHPRGGEGVRGGAVTSDVYTLPDGLPAPVDDGACDHLPGLSMPSLTLDSSHGPLGLRALAVGRLVFYVYPRTGTPGRPTPAGWDDIPGARGCTPQSCAFRDRYSALRALGAAVAGLSAQPIADQLGFAERNHIPDPVIADPDRRLGAALRLPTFEFEGATLYKRVTLIFESVHVAKVFYPVFPPDRNAADVIGWLQGRGV